MISDTLKFFEYSHTKNTTCLDLETSQRIQCCKWTSHFYHIQVHNSFSIQITTAIYMEYHFLRYGNSFCHFSSAFRQIKLNIRTSFKYYIRSLKILKNWQLQQVFVLQCLRISLAFQSPKSSSDIQIFCVSDMAIKLRAKKFYIAQKLKLSFFTDNMKIAG